MWEWSQRTDEEVLDEKFKDISKANGPKVLSQTLSVGIDNWPSVHCDEFAQAPYCR